MITYFKSSKLKLAALIVAGETFLSQLLRLGSNLILTRLLAPEMFGIMMIAMIFIVGITMLSNLGLREKFVQSENSLNQEFVNTCWSLQVVRGGVITVFVLCFSIILYFFNEIGYVKEDSTYAVKELPIIIAVLGSTALMSGFNSIAIYDHYRNIRMLVLTKISLISQFSGTSLMIIVAFFYKEVWVLLISPVVASAISLVLSYKYQSKIKAVFGFHKEFLKEIISFSKWIFIGSILSYAAMNADRLILGGFFTPEELGVFSIAFLLATAAKELFGKIIKNVIYPKMTLVLRNNSVDFKKEFYALRLKVDLVTYALSGFLFGCGSVVVDLLYDDRYKDAGWMFQILAIAIVFNSLNVSQHALMALGKTFSFAYINFISLVFVVVVIPLAYFYLSIEWVIFLIAIKSACGIPILFYLQSRYGIFDFVKELRALPLFVIFYFCGIFFKETLTFLVY